MRSLDAEPVGIPHGRGPIDAIAIGASLGGPQALQKLLSGMPKDLSVPIAICQHMSAGFTSVFAEQLGRVTSLRVKEGEHREPFVGGTVYVAPSGKQMRVLKERNGPFIRLDQDFSDSLFVPSVDVLFSSIAQTFGSCAMAVLLTGMGSDGAIGMHAVRRAGGHTLCESEETAVSFGMPSAAIELGAAAAEVPIDFMASAVVERVRAGI